MTTADKIFLAALIAVLTLIVVLMQPADAQYNSDVELLSWAEIECGQGNTDACQLESNLLRK